MASKPMPSSPIGNAPRVSFVVPAFNEPPAIIRASLESVRAQSFADFECLVVDESTDPARALACRQLCDEDQRFVYIRPDQRIGLAASLNLGLNRARGEYVARFDSDDLCLPDRLALQVSYLDNHADIGVVGGALEIIDDDDRTLAYRSYPTRHDAIARGIHLTSTLAHPTVMFRRSAGLRFGAYDPAFRFAEDLDLWLRWMNAGVRFGNLPQVLVRYRQTSTRRNRQHWRFNLRARTRNLRLKHVLLRAVGIVGISLWMVLPAAVQEAGFRAAMLGRRRPTSPA